VIKERRELVLLNANSEAWMRTKLILSGKVHGWKEIALQITDQTSNQLTQRKCDYKLRHNEPDAWFIEPKEVWKKRSQNKSPDEADALVMGVYAAFRAKTFRMTAI